MRLIDADALIEKSLNEAKHYEGNDDIKHGYHNCQVLMYDAPTIDAVSVVRCKECKHYEGLAECEIIGECMGTNGYCSYGEREGE